MRQLYADKIGVGHIVLKNVDLKTESAPILWAIQWSKFAQTWLPHTKLTLNLFAAHYRQSPLQAAAILTWHCVSGHLVCRKCKPSTSMPSAVMQNRPSNPSAQAQNLIIPPAGQTICRNRLLLQLKTKWLPQHCPWLKDEERDEQGRRWSVQGRNWIAALISRSRWPLAASQTKTIERQKTVKNISLFGTAHYRFLNC